MRLVPAERTNAVPSHEPRNGIFPMLFEDPDGIRLEVNFVPGHGVLAEGAEFSPSGGYE